MKTASKPAEKVKISDDERFDVMKKACILTNLQLNVKVDAILEKLANGTVTERERREAVILSQVILNRESHK